MRHPAVIIDIWLYCMKNLFKSLQGVSPVGGHCICCKKEANQHVSPQQHLSQCVVVGYVCKNSCKQTCARYWMPHASSSIFGSVSDVVCQVHVSIQVPFQQCSHVVPEPCCVLALQELYIMRNIPCSPATGVARWPCPGNEVNTGSLHILKFKATYGMPYRRGFSGRWEEEQPVA